jgi:hypothetical protein
MANILIAAYQKTTREILRNRGHIRRKVLMLFYSAIKINKSIDEDMRGDVSYAIGISGEV